MKNTDVKYLESNTLSFLNNENAISTLHDIRRGIERELIRTTPEGHISNLSHPEALGSALTHPYITTDFAEAQLELVTPAMTERKATFDSLASLHHFVATQLTEDEIMWGQVCHLNCQMMMKLTLPRMDHRTLGNIRCVIVKGWQTVMEKECS